MKKKLLMMLSVAMVAVIAITGTMAYLTSTDSDVNVMTLGNVKIEQIEQQRDESGQLVTFKQGKPLFPAVFDGSSIPWADSTDWIVPGDQAWKVVEDNANVLDKFVTVKNTGISDAFVRTIIAFEGDATYGPMGEYIHVVLNSSNVDPAITCEWLNEYVEIDGVTYTIATFTYPKAIAKGEITVPSLKQVYMNKAATNEIVAEYGDTYDILVLSQAAQTAGFDNSKTALDTAFGNVTAAKVVEWFSDMDVPGTIDNASDAYDASLKSGAYTLTDDINTSDADMHYSNNREYAVRDGKEYVIDLNGHTINHDAIYQDGKSTGYTYLYTTAYNGKMTVNGEGTINSANSEGSACIIYAQGPSEVIINSGDFRVDKGIAVWAGKDSKVTINGGSFISTGSNGDEELIYSSGGVIDIYGGFFHNEEWEERPVNVADANRGTGFINIYGGTFVNFDPSTGGNDPSNIKVMDGYKVVSETQSNGDIWYTVVAE